MDTLSSIKIKDFILAACSGLIMPLAFPVFDFHILAWFCLVPLFYSILSKHPFHSFVLASTTGFIFHLVLIYWVVVAMNRYGEIPFILSVIIYILLSAVLSLFISVPVYLSSYVSRKSFIPFTAAIVFFWTACEYCKSWVLTGFPWENLGYSQYMVLPLIQISDITGVYAISFLIVLANCAVLKMIKDSKVVTAELALCIICLTGAFIYGFIKIPVSENKKTAGIKTALIQPNIAQDVKWDPSYLKKTVDILGRLTLESADTNPYIVIWPESATPFYFQAEDKYMQAVAELVENTGSYILLGSPSFEVVNEEIKYYNSAFLISPERIIVDRYDKIHLVPYGEYVPLARFFPFIEKMVAGVGDFTPGNKIKNFQLSDFSFASVICYEIIFPDLVRQFVKDGAEFVVNITNDAWFGRTSAPYQHLSMTVFRAVENRRYIARTANTGISAFIEPSGKIAAKTEIFTEAVLSDMIYCKDEITFYTQYGDVFAFFCCILCFFFITLTFTINQIKNNKFIRRKT